MAFAIGDEVRVVPLQKRGRIIEMTAAGRCRVQLGALAVWCDERDLDALSSPRKGTKKRSKDSGPPSDDVLATRGKSSIADLARLGSLDLHGLTVTEALEKVEVHLDAAIRAGLDELTIIHGISGGRLRAAVHHYLDSVPTISSYRIDPRNAGVTRVQL